MSSSDHAPADSGPLDLATFETLRRLSERSGKGVLDELVASFLHEASARLEQLRRRLAADDVAAVVEIAHKMKGASATLGARDLMAAYRELEERAREQDLAGIAEHVGRVEAEFERARAAFRDAQR